MRSKKKGFTLIELLIVVVIVGILALAAIPLITSNTEDARRAEGRSLLSGMRNQARVQYSKNAVVPANLTACGVTEGQRTGEFYVVQENIAGGTVIGTTATAAGLLSADSVGTDPLLTLNFNWDDGQSEFNIP